MVDQFYYDAVDGMQNMNVERNYILGWIAGYMGNPQIEEQRMTEIYAAGYTDGENKDTGNFAQWVSE